MQAEIPETYRGFPASHLVEKRFSVVTNLSTGEKKEQVEYHTMGRLAVFPNKTNITMKYDNNYN
nr:unnamed protein product [Callosobruchus analis]